MSIPFSEAEFPALSDKVEVTLRTIASLLELSPEGYEACVIHHLPSGLHYHGQELTLSLESTTSLRVEHGRDIVSVSFLIHWITPYGLIRFPATIPLVVSVGEYIEISEAKLLQAIRESILRLELALDELYAQYLVTLGWVNMELDTTVFPLDDTRSVLPVLAAGKNQAHGAVVIIPQLDVLTHVMHHNHYGITLVNHQADQDALQALERAIVKDWLPITLDEALSMEVGWGLPIDTPPIIVNSVITLEV